MVATCGLTSYLEDFRPSAETVSKLERKSPSRDEVPFADAFAPMRQYALDCFQVPVDLADALVEELSRSFNQVLLAHFSVKRDYAGFVRALWTGGWVELLAEYPVLARLLEQTVSLKIDEAREFGERLHADRSALRSLFGASFDHVVSIRSGMSDPHHGLRSVKIVEFASSIRLVYKPRNLDVDAAWSNLVTWLNSRGSLHLAAPRVLSRDTHGWAEFISHMPADDAAGIRRFYRRAGALLAVLYATRGSDCHFENLIAHGDHPVLIDAETLMQPEVIGEDDPASVSQVGLLPCHETANHGEVVMIGGLDNAMRFSTATRPSWQETNTDRMAFGQRTRIEFSWTNVPELNGRQVDADPYAEDVEAGFREMYRLIMAHREELLSPRGPLAPFRGTASRFVLRNTRAYYLLLRCAVLPQFLRQEKDYRKRIQDLLARVGTTDVGPAEQIAVAESAALEALDVPMFTIRTDSTSLFTESGREIAGVVARSGYDAAVTRVRSLDEHDLRRQIAHIHDSFRDAAAARPGTAPAKTWKEQGWTTELFVDEARRLGDLLSRTAVRDGSGSCYWTGPGFVSETGQRVRRSIDDGLMAGRPGVALFLAALYHVTGEERYREESLAALAITREAIRANNLNIEGIGGGTGIGSVIYALARTGRWLHDKTLAADAFRASRLVSPQSIEADSHFDVIYGAAGCILGLLAVGDTERAAACAEHLIAHQVRQPDGGSAWTGLAPKPATGFSHGAAGIAYALFRLDRCLHDSRYREAARSAIDYERANYSPADGNWLDVRAMVHPDWPRYGNSWCHGAPGIGLARLGALQQSDASTISEIDTALDWVERNQPAPIDHLCCGTFGSIELMLRASQVLDRPHLYERACRRAAALVAESRARGGYRLRSGVRDDLFDPSLFFGTAGIGYELLRLGQPQLPSVLLWE